MVLIGGWVPYLILQKYQVDENFEHVGSTDIDFVVDPKLIRKGFYKSIVEILEQNGFEQMRLNGNPVEFSYIKTINTYDIKIDFLSTPYLQNLRKNLRFIQRDLQAIVLEGVEIVSEHNYEEEIEGTLPNQRIQVKCQLQIADVVGSLVTKGLAIDELTGRSKAKDKYDIYSLITYYKEGEKSCAEEVKPYLGNEIVRKAMINIRETFRNETSEGPAVTGNFIHPDDEDARNSVIVDSFRRINRFLDYLDQ